MKQNFTAVNMKNKINILGKIDLKNNTLILDYFK